MRSSILIATALFLATSCKAKKEMPPDADAIVAEARAEKEALQKIASKVPAAFDAKLGPACGEPKKTLVLSRTDLERVFVKNRETFDFAKDGRKYECDYAQEPSGWIFPASFSPKRIDISLGYWETQRHPATIADLRKALDSQRPHEHVAVYLADQDTTGGCVSCGPNGTFQAATLNALVVVFDRKSTDVVCQLSLQVESDSKLNFSVRSGETENSAATRALMNNLRDRLRAAVKKRFRAED